MPGATLSKARYCSTTAACTKTRPVNFTHATQDYSDGVSVTPAGFFYPLCFEPRKIKGKVTR